MRFEGGTMKKNTEFRLIEYKGRHVVYIAFIVLNVLLSILISYTFSEVIDQITGKSSFAQIIRLLAFFARLRAAEQLRLRLLRQLQAAGSGCGRVAEQLAQGVAPHAQKSAARIRET